MIASCEVFSPELVTQRIERETLPGDETADGEQTAPGEETAPVEESAPGEKTVPGKETAPGEETAKKNERLRILNCRFQIHSNRVHTIFQKLVQEKVWL